MCNEKTQADPAPCPMHTMIQNAECLSIFTTVVMEYLLIFDMVGMPLGVRVFTRNVMRMYPRSPSICSHMYRCKNLKMDITLWGIWFNAGMLFCITNICSAHQKAVKNVLDILSSTTYHLFVDFSLNNGMPHACP